MFLLSQTSKKKHIKNNDDKNMIIKIYTTPNDINNKLSNTNDPTKILHEISKTAPEYTTPDINRPILNIRTNNIIPDSPN